MAAGRCDVFPFFVNQVDKKAWDVGSTAFRYVSFMMLLFICKNILTILSDICYVILQGNMCFF